MKWLGVVKWDDPVNPATRKAIGRLNHVSMEKLRFKDFMKLKVGGQDAFSRKKEGELDGMIDRRDRELVNKEFPDEIEMRTVVKRWVARGLQVAKAIRKVKIDTEIRDNATMGRRS